MIEDHQMSRGMRARGFFVGLGWRHSIPSRVGTLLAAVMVVSMTLAGQAWGAEPAAPAIGEHQPSTEAADGHQGGEHAPSINPKTLGLQLLNFAVLLFILVKFGGGAINKALAARHQQLKADLAAAADLRAVAEAKLARQEARLASLENEIADLRSGIKAEADAEKVRLIAAAEERAARIKSETAFVVDQQIREAEVRLRRDSAEIALRLAEDILKRSMAAGDQRRLLETFVADIEQGGAPPASPARAVPVRTA